MARYKLPKREQTEMFSQSFTDEKKSYLYEISNHTNMKSKLIGTLLFMCVLFPTHTIIAQNQDSLIIQKADELMNLLTTKNKNWDASWCKNCHSDIFSVLSNLELPPKYKLRIRLPELDGDHSHIYVWMSDIWKKDDNYLKYVKLKSITEESCWEWFLIYYMRNMLPAYGHAAYDIGEMFYSEKQWKKQIEGLKDSFVPDSCMAEYEKNANLLSESKYNKIKETKITPAQIILNAAKNEAIVSFYSWNDWEGLNYNQYDLKIKDDNTVEVANSTSETIIKYWCGVLY